MAARRLLIIMVVLLTISTLAAALVPPPQESEETTSTTSTAETTERERGGPPKADDLIRSEVAVPRRDRAPELIEVEPGDQLALTVTSSEPGEVSLPDFGLIEFAGPGNTATFNLLLEEEGRFPVRFQGSGQVATIVAESRKNARE